ncbi:MAG: helix-turn-helix domain-containing protein [Pirellulales bacterium]
MSVMTEYRDLLVKYLPQPIRSDRDHRRAISQLEQLMVPRPSAARSRLIEVLSTLVEDYESREYPTPQVPPSQVLAHLLNARGVKCADVARQTSIPPATLSSVLANRRGISKANAQKLARYFNVSPVVFLATEQNGVEPATRD